MWFFGQDYEELCEQKCRRYKVYADIYKKTESGEYTLSDTYTQDGDGGKPSIVSVKIVKGQTSGSFSYGGAFSGQLTLVTTADADIPPDDAKIVISVSFVSDEGVETEKKAPLGTFYTESAPSTLFTKTVKAVDGISKLTKHYVPQEEEFPMSALRLYEKIGKIAGVEATYERFFSLNNPTITEPPIKNAEGEESEDKYYTYRELAGMIASINAGNAFINAYNELDISTPDIGLKREVHIGSVINYTDAEAVNNFTTTFWAQTYEGEGTPPEIDPLSLEYDPSIMVIDFPLSTDNDYATMQANIDEQIGGISYNGVIIKKQGTGRQDIGDLLAFTDTNRGKVFDNILVMGIVYDISARGGFTETLYSLSQSEAKQQAKGLSLNSKVDNMRSGGNVSSSGVGEFTNESKNSEIFNCYEDVMNSDGTTVLISKNYIGEKTQYAHIAGQGNSIDKESDNSTSSSICGGSKNSIFYSCPNSAILGGGYNSISNGSVLSVIGGGTKNSISNASTYVAIVSGSYNVITQRSQDSAILSGYRNSMDIAQHSTILGGSSNELKNGSNSAILCGVSNTIAESSAGSSIINGYKNNLGTSTQNSSSGGSGNEHINTINSLSFGSYNKLVRTIDCIVCGKNNLVSGVDDCIVCGEFANVTTALYCYFVIGNGASDSNRRNCFYVDRSGNVYAKSFNIIGAEAAADVSSFSTKTASENTDLSELLDQINQMKTDIEALKEENEALKTEITELKNSI